MSSWAPLKMECHQAKTTCYHQTVLNSLQKPLWCHQAAKKSEAVAVNCSGGSGRTGAVISSHYHLSFHFGDQYNFFSIMFSFHVSDSPTRPFWALVILGHAVETNLWCDIAMPNKWHWSEIFHIHDSKLLLFLVKHCYSDEDNNLNLAGDFILSLCLL